MKKCTLVCLLMALNSSIASAQFGYNFTTYQSPYTSLVNDTDVSIGSLWLFQSFQMPIGFTFQLDNNPISQSTFYYCQVSATAASGVASGFHVTDAHLVDRGFPGQGAPESPISYVVTGTPGARIFKMQMANAGFDDEMEALGTTNDFMNAQVWYYEDSNIVEIHYGDAQVSFAETYYTHGGPLVGLIRNVNLASFTPTYDAIYYLTGNPQHPTVDSVSPTGFASINAITSLPASGTVYRFTPASATTGVNTLENDPNIKAAQVNSRELMITMATGHSAVYNIITVDGKKTQYSGTLTPGRNDLNYSQLVPGLYILNVEMPGKHYRQKIVVM